MHHRRILTVSKPLSSSLSKDVMMRARVKRKVAKIPLKIMNQRDNMKKYKQHKRLSAIHKEKLS